MLQKKSRQETKCSLSVLLFLYVKDFYRGKISDVGSAGVWWFQFDAEDGRQPTGNSRFCSSLNSAVLPSLPPATVSAPN